MMLCKMNCFAPPDLVALGRLRISAVNLNKIVIYLHTICISMCK